MEPNGFIRGRSAGVANIIATMDGVSGQATLRVGTVAPEPPAGATNLAMVRQPSSTAVNGVAFEIQPSVGLRDASGNPVRLAGIPVSAAIATGTGTLGGSLSALTDSSGVATFTNLSITGSVGARTLTFTAAALVAATSIAINVTAGAASRLAVVTQPSSAATSGEAFSVQPAVALFDGSNNLVSQAGVTVSASIASGGGTLGGVPTAITDANGVATFAGLSISGSDGPRTLGFGAPGLSSASSNTISVTSGAEPPPPPPPPPPSAAVLFRSDWSTGLGTSDAVLRDATKSPSWCAIGGEGLEVISSAGLDFPTANVLRVTAVASRTGFAMARIGTPFCAGIAVPAVGESRYYRWYIRNMMDVNTGLTNVPHPMQDGNAASLTNWAFATQTNVGGAGHWRPRFSFVGNGWPNSYNGPILQTNVTYRFEVQVLRTGMTTFNFHVRIYDSAGRQINGDADFLADGGPHTLASNPTLTFNDVANMNGLNAGSNHAATSRPYPFVEFYQGGFAICADTWCGPYAAGR